MFSRRRPRHLTLAPLVFSHTGEGQVNGKLTRVAVFRPDTQGNYLPVCLAFNEAGTDLVMAKDGSKRPERISTIEIEKATAALRAT